MGQTHTGTIIQQEALSQVQKNPHWRVIKDAEEINECLSITSILDQMSFDLSNSNWIVSNLTINPLSYDPIAISIQQRELEIKAQSKILYKLEAIQVSPVQRKFKTVTTQTETKGQQNELEYGQINGNFMKTGMQVQLSEKKQKEQQEDNFRFKHRDEERVMADQRVKQEQQPNQQTKQQIPKKIKREKSEQPLHIQYQQVEIRREKSNEQNRFGQFIEKKVQVSQQSQATDEFQKQLLEKSVINPFKLQNEITENFSNDEDNSTSMLSISQNFQVLRSDQQQSHQKSFIQNERYWSSDHSSTIIDIPSQVMQKAQTQNSLKHPLPNQQQVGQLQEQFFSSAQRRLTQQQSFGSKQNQFQPVQQQPMQTLHQQQQKLILSNNQKDVIIKQQPQNYLIASSLPMDQIQEKQPVQNYYSDKKQFAKSPTYKDQKLHQHQYNKQNSPKTTLQQQKQQESMRQQFDRLLRESQSKKVMMKPNCKPVASLKQSDSEQELQLQSNQKQLTGKNQQPVIRNEKKNSPLNNGKFQAFNQPLTYAERNKLKQKLNQSPPNTFQSLKQARNIQKQEIVNHQQSNLQLQKLNEKIEWISRMNQDQEEGDKIITSIKQNVSNLKTAITQNISPSERGDKNSNTNRFSNREEDINIDNLPDYQEESINLDRLSSYRESVEQKIN